MAAAAMARTMLINNRRGIERLRPREKPGANARLIILFCQSSVHPLTQVRGPGWEGVINTRSCIAECIFVDVMNDGHTFLLEQAGIFLFGSDHEFGHVFARLNG